MILRQNDPEPPHAKAYGGLLVNFEAKLYFPLNAVQIIRYKNAICILLGV